MEQMLIGLEVLVVSVIVNRNKGDTMTKIKFPPGMDDDLKVQFLRVFKEQDDEIEGYKKSIEAYERRLDDLRDSLENLEGMLKEEGLHLSPKAGGEFVGSLVSLFTDRYAGGFKLYKVEKK